ncbi:hypothetical protein [Trinickia sp.]|uniref:hypothetical protein n=1 Tax=Trinickia sp. TaxID=2571163 RepID=UPI003F802A91
MRSRGPQPLFVHSLFVHSLFVHSLIVHSLFVHSLFVQLLVPKSLLAQSFIAHCRFPPPLHRLIARIVLRRVSARYLLLACGDAL